jgi:hypothetical protein
MSRLAPVLSVLFVLGACGGDAATAEDTDGGTTESGSGAEGADSSGSEVTSASTTGPGSTTNSTETTETTETAETTGSAETTGETGEEPSCDGIGFDAEASVWALPDLGALPLDVVDPVNATGDSWSCTNGRSFRYTTMDLTGDGQLDFVITDGCDVGGVGADRWVTHLGLCE